MLKILYSKFLRYIDESTFGDLAQTMAKLFCWAVISISLVNIPEARENFAMAIKWHNFALPKIFASYLFIFYIREILGFIKNIIFSLLEEIHGIFPKEWNMYKWIPIIELVDYLFSSEWYSRAEFCDHFGVSRKVFDDMAEWFDKIGVFIRWKNNARVLSDEYARSDIVSILTRAGEGEIRPLMREVKWWYTHSPSHGFTTKSLHSSNWLPV